MPKKGEKARKIRALSRGVGVRPPKKWFHSGKNHREGITNMKSGGHVHTGKDRKGKHSHPEYRLKNKGHKRK